jgi:elongation factor G
VSRNIETLRNIGIIAHIDAGKTTVTERMLFLSGAKHRVGRVDDGNTTTDEDAEEQNRGITIYSACVTFDWNKVHINLLDTPGHVDFTAEVERCLRVLDGAVVVFSAREGVEAQSETVWRQADKYNVPRVAFINKMDREGAEFDRVFEEMRVRLKATPIPIAIPAGQGPSHVDDPFRGIIDLIQMQFVTFAEEGKTVTRTEIPADLKDTAEFWRAELLEKLYSKSDQLMELAMSEEPIPVELIKKVLRDATLSLQIQPLLCGSALHGIGVQMVLDAVADFLPSPADMPPVIGLDPNNPEKKLSRKPSIDEPFCGLVFKILPAKTGDLYWVRVYSGEMKSNTRALCPGKDKKENVAQLWQIHATRKNRDGQVDKVSTGDIVGVIGPRFAVTGDTLCDAKDPIELESIEFPETVIEMAIEPETTAERKKLSETLEMLKRQDPTFSAKENEETGQTLISGMGELHLEVIENRLLRDFNLNVKVHKPRVSYRETIETHADSENECHRMFGGQQLYAKVHLKLEPDQTVESGVKVVTQIPPDSIPKEFLTAAIEEIKSRGLGGGPIGSFPLTKIKATLLEAEANEQSTDVAFSIAAGEAFEEALSRARPVLLEPIMRLSITTPDEYYGEFINDLNQRRGRIVDSDNRAGITFIDAQAPLAELFGYSNAMRSLSHGRASASMEPLGYEPAPAEVANNFGM